MIWRTPIRSAAIAVAGLLVAWTLDGATSVAGTSSKLQIREVRLLPAGDIELELQTSINRTIVVELSTNLIDWTSIWRADVIPPDGMVTAEIGPPPETPPVFFRAFLSGTSTNRPLTRIEGPPGDRVNSHLPDLEMPVEAEADVILAKDVLPVSLRHVLAVFDDATVVQAANELLAQESLEIAAGIPAMKVVLLRRDPIGTLDDLAATLSRLRASGLFRVVAPNIGMDLPRQEPVDASRALSLAPPSSVAAWSWEVPPLGQGLGGNNAFEMSRVPQLWNWLDHGWRQRSVDGTHHLAVVEFAYYTLHEDLPTDAVLQSGNDPSHSLRQHGLAVTGVVGARRDNEQGIQGVTPFPTIEGFGIGRNGGAGWSGSYLELMTELRQRKTPSPPRVFNMSFGVNWGTNNPSNFVVSDFGETGADWVDDLGDLWAEAFSNLNEDYGDHYLVFCGAGNDSGMDARYSSPMANIACRTELLDLAPNFVAVENVDSTGFTHSTSSRDIVTGGDTRGASISAGGSAITVLDGPTSKYRTPAFGTSFSSPLAAGIASFLWTLDDTLSPGNVKFLMSHADTTYDVPGGGANLVDAFAAALRIDELRVGKPLQKALVDVDDGTLDGNLRLKGLDFEKDPDQIHTSDGRRGDGKIGMADFRAFRDAYLQAIGETNFLDGPATHFKRDINFDGVIAGQVVSPSHPTGVVTPSSPANAPAENIFPRFDFNGNGMVDAGNILHQPPATAVSPFKVDPETVCSGRDLGRGCLRDVDVLLDPEFWEVGEENVVLEGGEFLVGLPGITAPDAEWSASNIHGTNLFAGFLPVTHLVYLWSFDLHLDMEATDPNAPRNVTVGTGGMPVQVPPDGFWIHSAATYGKSRGGEWKGVVTMPLHHPQYHPTGPLPPGIVPVYIAYKRTVGDEWRSYQLAFDPGLGEDVVLEVGFDRLECRSTSRGIGPDFWPRQMQGEMIAKVPGASPYATRLISNQESPNTFAIADEMAKNALASRLKLPSILGGAPNLRALFEVERIDEKTSRISVTGIVASYQ